MNKVILMGRLTKDPELKFTQTKNTANCKFTLAVDRRFKDASGQKQTDFIPIITWSKTAEFCAKYFSKGQKVAVVGSAQTRHWDDNDGKRHYATEVVADEAYFAESKDQNKNDAYEPETVEEYEEPISGDGLPF